MPSTPAAFPSFEGSASDLVSTLLARCAELSKITDERGRLTRGCLSPAMERATTRVALWMQQAGLDTELDVAGNLVGSRPSPRSDAPLLVLGSHLDTVRDAGHYDGVLGVLLAIAAVERLGSRELPFDLEVISFVGEEGLRFGVPFLGSKTLIGELEPELLARTDADGITLEEAMRAWAGDPSSIACRYGASPTRRLLGYFEAHIEQGPWLEHRDLPVGVLDALCASCWLRLRFHGEAGHAGTTPMDLRRDPLPAAAEMVLHAERLAQTDGSLVATVGQLRTSPGASNVIPGSVELSLDLRHPDSRRLRDSLDLLLDLARDLARRRGLRFEHEIVHHQEGEVADDGLSDLLTRSVAATGVEPERLVIGAGHDALVMARRMPMTMLLVRSPGGISHHPDETVLPGDVAIALDAMGHFLDRLATRERAVRGRGREPAPLPVAATPPPEDPSGVFAALPEVES